MCYHSLYFYINADRTNIVDTVISSNKSHVIFYTNCTIIRITFEDHFYIRVQILNEQSLYRNIHSNCPNNKMEDIFTLKITISKMNISD